ncbi:MAG: nuclease-related domain-containing protein [Halothiobacillaceae bacterium]
MDDSPIFSALLKLGWLVPILLLATMFKTSWFKGWLGEAWVKFAAWLGLPKNTYHRMHNVTMPTPDGTTQIDHIIVSRFGIFVVETKNMNGWIFGRENQAFWTQKIFKKSYPFQNPLHQNFKHIKTLEIALDVSSNAIHSLIVFVGQSTFKTPMPANVTQGGDYITYIKSFSQPVLNEEQVLRTVALIQSKRLDATWKTHRQHVKHLQARTNPSAERK